MRPPGPASLIAEWLAKDDVEWEAPEDVTAWAASCHEGIEGAWRDCRRADHLMALAGATSAPTEDVLTAACVAARGAQKFVPAEEVRPAEALRFAMTYRPTAGFEPDPELLAAQRVELGPIFDALEGEELSCLQGMRSAGEAARRLLADRPASLLARAAGDEQEPAVRVLNAVLAEPPLVALEAAHRAHRRLLSYAHAVRATQSVLVVATSAAMATKARRLANHLLRLASDEPAPTPEHTERVVTALAVAERSTARVFTEAALLFHNAASAFGHEAAAREDAWRAAVASVFTQALSAEPSARRDLVGDYLDQVEARARASKLAEFAENVRRAVPLTPHRPREMLRRAIATFEPMAALLGGADVVEPIALALAVLDAPGALDRRKLASALGILHERVAVLLERQRSLHPEDAGEDLERTVTAARSAILEMRALVDAMPEERSN